MDKQLDKCIDDLVVEKFEFRGLKMQQLIPIQTGDGGGSSVEWTVLEVQGSLIFDEPGNMKSLDIGSMTRKAKDAVEIQIANHILKGKIVALKKPFAVFEKVKDADEMDTEETQILYRVRGIVRRKILCTTRPKAILHSAQR